MLSILSMLQIVSIHSGEYSDPLQLFIFGLFRTTSSPSLVFGQIQDARHMLCCGEEKNMGPQLELALQTTNGVLSKRDH